jgi:hypothetical protein
MRGVARADADHPRSKTEPLVPAYNPELIRTMRAVLDEAVSTLPAHRATPEIKAHVAQLILEVAADGETSHRGLLDAASKHLSRFGSMVTREFTQT